MIEIIKEGKIRHKAKCDECGCLFAYDAEDVTWKKLSDGRFTWGDQFLIDCPYCHKQVILYNEEALRKERDKMRKG